MNGFELSPGPLRGEHVVLEPLQRSHSALLWRAGAEAKIWRYLPYHPIVTLPDAERWIDDTLAMAATGTEKPFAIVFAGEVIGSTRFMDIRTRDKGVEIGGTWITPKFQRTIVNTECKYLLLRDAFEQAGACRVQLTMSVRNALSNASEPSVKASYERTWFFPTGTSGIRFITVS